MYALERDLAVVRDLDDQAHVFQQRARDQLIDVVVLDQQHARSPRLSDFEEGAI